MLKFCACIFSLLYMIYGREIASQPLQIDERFGMQLHFSDEWSLLSEDLYSPVLQRQLFATENEQLFVYVEKALVLHELQKQDWASGLDVYPLSYADTVITVPQDEWLFDAPDFKLALFSDYPNGISVFYAEATNWLGYVVFLSRAGAFTKLNISASKEGFDPDIADLTAIISTLLLPEEPPVVQEDPYTTARYAFMVVKDYENAIRLYKEIEEDHPKYADAQRTIGYNILGKQFDDWTAAIPFVEEAFRVAPDDPKVLEDIGRVYLKANRVDEGIALLEKAGTHPARAALKAYREESNR